MSGVRVVITFEGLDTVIGNLSRISEKAPQNLEALTRTLAGDTKSVWKQNTPSRSGKLRDADTTNVEGLSFTLQNSVYYYKFVDEGHMTPAGWRTKHGYRPAKRRSHVAAQDITPKTLEFVEQNIAEYLSKFLDDV